MKKLLLTLCSCFFANYAAAALISFADTITDASPAVTVSWCSGFGDKMVVREFSVDTTGTYSFANINASSNLFVQINPTPDNSYTPLINIDTYGSSPVAASPSGDLTAGVTYYLVAVSACAPSFPLTFSVDLSGPGSINVIGQNPTSTPVSIPTLSEWAMIIMASLMAMFAIGRMRRQ